MTDTRRISVSFPGDLAEALDRIATGDGHRSLASVIRRAVSLFVTGRLTAGTVNPSDPRGPWRAERSDRHLVAKAPHTSAAVELQVTYYRGPAEGRHTVTVLDDGRAIDVRPDGRTSASNRSRVIGEAIRALHDSPDPFTRETSFDPLTYIVGALTLAGATAVELIEGDAPDA